MSRWPPVSIWMMFLVLAQLTSTSSPSNSSERLLDTELDIEEEQQQWTNLNASVLLFDEARGASAECGRDRDQLDLRKSLCKAATELAIKDAGGLLDGQQQVNVDFVSLKGDCFQTGGLLSLVGLLSNDSVNAVIGSVTSSVCGASIALAKAKVKPFVSWGCFGSDEDVQLSLMDMDKATAITSFGSNRTKPNASLSSVQKLRHRVRHSNFYSVSPSATSCARALVLLIKHFRWKQSAIVAIDDDDWLTLANRIDLELRHERHVVRHFVVLPASGSDQLHQIRAKLATIVAHIKVVILCVPLGSQDMEYVLQVEDELLTNRRGARSGRTFFAVHVRHSFASFAPPSRTSSNVTAPFVFTYVPANATYRETCLKRNAKLVGGGVGAPINVIKDEADYQLFQRVYDCMALLLAILVTSSRTTTTTASSSSSADDDGGTIVARGLLGPIVSSPSDGAVFHYALLHYDASRGRRRYAPVLYVRGDRVVLDNDDDDVIVDGVQLPPPDISCELDDKDECVPVMFQDSQSAPMLHLVAVVASSAFLCVSLICLGLLVRRIVRRRDMTKGPYGILIYPGDLILVVPHSQLNSNSKHLSDFPGLERPDLLKGSHDSLRGFPASGSPKPAAASTAAATVVVGPPTQTPSPSEPCSNVTRARYKGDLVLVKYLQSRALELRNKTLKELRMIHDLRHENVNTFIGYFVNPERPALVFEYCTRGSLQDVLASENMKLDWAFKLSLLTDLVRGVRYLHSSPIRVHGRLTSRNCVIDSRWVLKVTDYGVNTVVASQGLPLPKTSASGLLWTAPELLRSDTLFRTGTQPGDVYSFSIIMQEVLVRGPPYCMLPLTAEEIIEKVMHPPPMIRPSVSKQAAPPEAINIMRECWAEGPDMRPDFTVIYDQFKRLNHGKKVNIVDTMFQMLEKYSNNLEEIIRERTEQLAEEKKKTEQLLHRMLPSSVAERLKMGLPVEPEAYEEVTIYFSDIVGFTTISAYSTPQEVIFFLNELYTSFDATINAYNVYKVETIGDAYMVVGGLPVRIEDHACQVAQMALELLHQSGKFKIQHLPLTRLRLRIGIHTGPCCAGVVGLTMPRYCLFGDTVNTASRMESTGQACRIHISEATKEKLDQAGGYHISCRGEIELKGKGRATSYWLLGKEGFDKPLPAPMDNEETSLCFEEELLRQCQALPRLSEIRLSSIIQDDMDEAASIDAATSAELAGGWCAASGNSSFDHHRPSMDSDTGNDVQLCSAIRNGHSQDEGSGSQVLELGRRTMSNASEILTGSNVTASGCVGGNAGNSPDTQSVHSQPHPASHAHAQLHHHHTKKVPLVKLKALEYIANANSYILNLNRAQSLDIATKDVAGKDHALPQGQTLQTSSSQLQQITLLPTTASMLCPRLCSHVAHARSSGDRLDNEPLGGHHHLHHLHQHHHHHQLCNNRRSSEILESNVHRNQATSQAAIRRYSNPRYFAERNGNFLTVASAANPSSSSDRDRRRASLSSSDRRSSLDIRLTTSALADLMSASEGAMGDLQQSYQHDVVNVKVNVDERDNIRTIDSSL